MKTAIVSISILLAACGGGGGGSSEHHDVGRELRPGEICRARLDQSQCPIDAIYRKPFEFEHCKIELDENSMCPLEELEHNVPNLGQLCKGSCPENVK